MTPGQRTHVWTWRRDIGDNIGGFPHLQYNQVPIPLSLSRRYVSNHQVPIILFFQDIYWRLMIWMMMMRKRMMNCGLSCLQPITQFKIAFLFWPQGPSALAVKIIIIIIIFSGLYHHHLHQQHHHVFRFLKMTRACCLSSSL